MHKRGLSLLALLLGWVTMAQGQGIPVYDNANFLQNIVTAAQTTITAIVRQVPDEQVLEMTIVENLQRTDLNPMEQARAYQRLSTEFKPTQEQMAQKTGKERASVANFLRLLRLPEGVQSKVETGELTFGHARALLALDTPEAITSAAQKVLAL